MNYTQLPTLFKKFKSTLEHPRIYAIIISLTRNQAKRNTETKQQAVIIGKVKLFESCWMSELAETWDMANKIKSFSRPSTRLKLISTGQVFLQGS